MVYVPLNNTMGPSAPPPHHKPLWRRHATIRWFIVGAAIAVVVYIAGAVYGWQYLKELLPSANEIIPTTPKEDIIYGTSWTKSQLQQWKNECQELGGRFNECGSACADPTAVCIQVCAARCEL